MDNLPKEIVAEILVRLRLKHLFRSKCVSKQWNSIISDPKLGQNYLQRLRSSSRESKPTSSTFATHEINHPQKAIFLRNPFSSTSTDKIDHMASSDGLVLSSTSPNYGYITDYKFHVSNPLTNQSKALPWLSLPCRKWVYGFATRFTTFVTYKVVIIQRVYDPHSVRCTIEIFSSDIGRWTSVQGTIVCPKLIFNDKIPKPANYKGVLHWFDWHTRSLVTYDPYDNPNVFSRVYLPSTSICVSLTQLGHENMLKFGELVDDSLVVWRLVDYRKGQGEWCIEQRIPIRLLRYNRISGLISLVKKRVAWNEDLFCYIDAKGENLNMVSSVKVWDCKDKVMGLKNLIDRYLLRRQDMFPMAVSPWSSPFYCGR